eukprot:TRINITY_DN12061_c0_g1_i1.p1 TRINITY_DN12061_c0_g1~~TRINITY_DN12061_c0_g1_i1.p1  ORF type:complete len:149 (+),score=18.89 TRINITY_DN12061_c0_g1_i1:47-448(+)
MSGDLILARLSVTSFRVVMEKQPISSNNKTEKKEESLGSLYADKIITLIAVAIGLFITTSQFKSYIWTSFIGWLILTVCERLWRGNNTMFYLLTFVTGSISGLVIGRMIYWVVEVLLWEKILRRPPLWDPNAR